MAMRRGDEEEKGGRVNPHDTGQRIQGEPIPRADEAEPASGARRDPLPNEYQDEGSDLPGPRKKIT